MFARLYNPFQPLLDLFREPSAYQLAQRKIAEYQLQQIQCEEAAAYNAKMAEYYKDGITRLKKHREA